MVDPITAAGVVLAAGLAGRLVQVGQTFSQALLAPDASTARLARTTAPGVPAAADPVPLEALRRQVQQRLQALLQANHVDLEPPVVLELARGGRVVEGGTHPEWATIERMIREDPETEAMVRRLLKLADAVLPGAGPPRLVLRDSGLSLARG